MELGESAWAGFCRRVRVGGMRVIVDMLFQGAGCHVV